MLFMVFGSSVNKEETVKIYIFFLDTSQSQYFSFLTETG